MNVGHFLVGIEGLALLRTWLVGSRDVSDRRIDALARLVGAPDRPPLSFEVDAPETDVPAGYARWAANYDAIPNPLIRAEEPVMHALIDPIAPGTALDAACGTGRHARRLAACGHRVVGLDVSREMLVKARGGLPGVQLGMARLAALPLATASVDLAVCALALTHCEELAPPIAELARVLRPGGRLLISDLHPLLTALGMTAFFVAEDGSAAYVRSYHHLPGAYLAAFRAAGLEVRQCIEPVNGEEEVVMVSGGMMDEDPEAFRTALLGLPQAIVWDLIRSAA